MKWLRKEATLKNLNIMIEFILNNLKKDTDITEKINMEIRLLCEEALMNIISYAYEENENTGEMIVGYKYDKKNNCIILKICDYGIKFNPIEKEDPNLTGDIMERNIGGLGVFLIKKISDFITYERKFGMNILTIQKHFISPDKKN
ncbi:MAG: ATP-binding protein [Clostridium sp.]